MSFPAYEEYKDSGVEWLGDVPKHWEPTRLKLLVREVQDRVGESSHELLGLSKSLGVVRRSELEQGASESDDYSKYKIAPSGYLVMNKMQAWNGVFGISPILGMVSPDYAVFQFLEKSAAKFLCSLFRTDLMAGVFFTRCRGMGTAFLRLNTNDFLDIKVPLPLVPEQTAIASFLDTETSKIDGLVSEQRRLIELLKEKRQAVISHAVTKGLNPDVKMKPSGIQWLGDVPEHWTTPPLYTRYEQVLGKMLDQNKLTGEHPMPYVRNVDVQWDRVNADELPVIDIKPNEVGRFTIRNGDLLICEGGELGRTAIWNGDDNIVAFQKAIHRLRPLNATECSRYFYYIMRFATGMSVFLANSNPNTIPHLTGEQLRAYRFPKPPIDEQVEIADFLDTKTGGYDTLQAQAERAIELLQERRTALISAAVTGKIDVRGYAQTKQEAVA